MKLRIFSDSFTCFTLTSTSGLEKFFGGLDNNVACSGKRLYLAKLFYVTFNFCYRFQSLGTDFEVVFLCSQARRCEFATVVKALCLAYKCEFTTKLRDILRTNLRAFCNTYLQVRNFHAILSLCRVECNCGNTNEILNELLTM